MENSWISNMYSMITSKYDTSVFDWSDDGNGFIIKDLQKFSSSDGILSKFYKNKEYKYSTFLRSLSWYNFKCIYNSKNIKKYYHIEFNKNSPEKILLIKRKNNKNYRKLYENIIKNVNPVIEEAYGSDEVIEEEAYNSDEVIEEEAYDSDKTTNNDKVNDDGYDSVVTVAIE